ncbi:MAG TPA: lytic transglycosylase domain-containing protein [Marmoricola sp.]
MPVASFKRKSKVATIVPLAIVSGLWSVSLIGYNAAQANGSHNQDLPDGTKVPSSAIQAPANLPQPGTAAPAVPQGKANQVVAGASTSGIPATALSAYQNASRIIDSADKSCNLPWELVAAIGRVESDHGRYDGNHLNAKGIAVPGIFGPVLNGKHGTQLVADTDDGTIDGNKSFDRAVGPMQFIPSTWQVVKVDADNDGKRNPQDINDASLATAVYLCSGSENLANRGGEEAAVYRYNHSHSYVNLVLRIMEAYQTGDYTSVPSSSLGGTLLAPNYATAITKHRKHTKTSGTNTTGNGDNPGGGATTGTGDGGGSNGGSSGSGGSGNSGGGASGNPTDGSSPMGSLASAISGAVSAAPSILENVLSQAAATTVCNQQLQGIPLIGTVLKAAVPLCAAQVKGHTEATAIEIIPNTLKGVLKWLGL